VSPSFAGVASETQQTAWQAIACRNGGLSTRNGYIDCSSTQKSRQRHWIVAATTPLAAKVHSTTHAPSAFIAVDEKEELLANTHRQLPANTTLCQSLATSTTHSTAIRSATAVALSKLRSF